MMTWVLRASGVPHDVVMAVEALKGADVRKKWITLLESSREELEERDGDDLAVRSDGLLMLARPDQQAVIVVPESERQALVQRIHEEFLHAGVRRTLRALQNTYTWPSLAADVRRGCLCV